MTLKVGQNAPAVPAAPAQDAAPGGLAQTVKSLESSVVEKAEGWLKKSPALEQAAGKAIGYVEEYTGFRYGVKHYQEPVSPTLTRGSRLESGADYADLKNRGFKGIVDLTLEGTKDERLAKPAGLNALNVKILDNSAPTTAQMKQFLDFATAPANQPCYVHCEAGQGRTGVAVACYRMAVQGWTPEQALADAKAHGLQLEEQVAFLQRFGADLKAGKIAGYPLAT